ncbi:DUF6082 family protein [Streptomyces sp. NBC_01465]|uniref:DUF6082 family protein n=1 Tax=Streptomyces sp. NBC_01465 TaxID=2903878 RepID=UPI002E34BE1B|nr:DUF6082 family protein [Streptomyces sp. NBC_01465]
MATQKLGMLEAVAAGIAAGGAAGLAVLVAQHRSLVERRRHDKNVSLGRQQQLLYELLTKAIDDPDLAAVLDTYDEDFPHATQRQYLFANILYTNALLAHRVGLVSKQELFGHLRQTFNNRIVRDYWRATSHHRQSLVSTSEEARAGRMMDALIRELDENDEEWWIVGQPPAE